MSDDIDSGPIVSGEVAPAPSETPRAPTSAPDEKSREQIVKEQFNMGLGLAAHGTEDATDYIKERQTQDRHLAGEDLSGAQMREWHERTHSALQRAADAAARARGEIPPSQQQMSEENIPGYISPADPNYDAHIEANKARFGEYFDNPENIGSSLTATEHKKSVMDWILTYDPKNVLIGHFMASPLGPQMMEALEGESDAIKYLANLPPAIRAGEMKKLEGFIHAKQMMASQGTYEPQPRRHTAAPPPITPPRGAANPPSDLRSLAGKDDVQDYVKARQQQERRYREKWE